MCQRFHHKTRAILYRSPPLRTLGWTAAIFRVQAVSTGRRDRANAWAASWRAMRRSSMLSYQVFDNTVQQRPTHRCALLWAPSSRGSDSARPTSAVRFAASPGPTSPRTSDFVERQRQMSSQVGIGGRAAVSVLVCDVAGVEFGCAEAAQQVLDLVDGLDRRRRVVDRGRQGLDGDVDEKPDWIFGVLLDCSFAPEMNSAQERVFRQRFSRAWTRRRSAPSTSVSPTAQSITIVRCPLAPMRREPRVDPGDGAGRPEDWTQGDGAERRR